jgi:hypothetical protein
VEGAQKKMFMWENKIKIFLYVKPFEFDATLYECYDKKGNMLGYVPTKYEEKDISFNLKNLSLDDIERV